MQMACEITVTEQQLTRELEYDFTPILHYDIRYPQFEGEGCEKGLEKINAFYSQRAQRLALYACKDLFAAAADQYDYDQENGFPVMPYELVANYTVTLNNGCTLSLYWDQYIFTGGAHGNTTRYGHSWDVKAGCALTLQDFFPRNFDYKIDLTEQIIGQIAEQIAAGNDIYFDDYEENVIAEFNPQNFYLTPEGLVIFYQQYAIAPYSSGIMEFTIPYYPCALPQ